MFKQKKGKIKITQLACEKQLNDLMMVTSLKRFGKMSAYLQS